MLLLDIKLSCYSLIELILDGKSGVSKLLILLLLPESYLVYYLS